MISLHVGQAGSQIGQSFWEVANAECLGEKTASSLLYHAQRRRLGMVVSAGASTAKSAKMAGVTSSAESNKARCVFVDSWKVFKIR